VIAHFLGALIDEQNEEGCLRMVDRHAFDNRLEKHRFSGAGGRDDQCALAVADWGDEIDGASCQLGAGFGGFPRLEL